MTNASNRRQDMDRREGHQARFPKDDRQSRDRRVGERRIKDRIPVKMWIKNINGNENYFQQTGNLSASGMYILAPTPQPINSELEVEFIIPGTEKVVRCRAVTLNIKEDGDFFGTSVKFTNILHDDRKSIEKAVDNLISEFWYILEE